MTFATPIICSGSEMNHSNWWIWRQNRQTRQGDQDFGADYLQEGIKENLRYVALPLSFAIDCDTAEKRESTLSEYFAGI